MRSLLLAVVLCGGCALDQDLFAIPECGRECAVNADGIIVFDDDAFAVTCNTGTSICVEVDGETTVTVCDGWRPLSEEVCDADGVDEDCNGSANDIVYEYYEPENTCVGLGECQYQTQFCNVGEMICVPDSVFYGEEVCDGRDNDCDGKTDSDDDDLIFVSRFNYSGDPDTLNVGECRAGVLRCEDGLEYFFGEVLPTEEICGNGDDDDCDGFTDEDDDDDIADAFLLSIDFSGSMSGTIEAVVEALCEWSENSIFTNSRFAIQAVGTYAENDPFISNVTGFITASQACFALQLFMINSMGGGLEFIPYGIWGVNNDPALRLTWPADMRRRVVFFSDEPPQGNKSSADAELRFVANDCVVNRYTVGGFVGGSYAQWRTMTDPCGGWIEQLSPDPVQLREDLNRRFGSECGG